MPIDLLACCPEIKLAERGARIAPAALSTKNLAMWILRLIIELDMHAQVFLSRRYTYASILHKTSPSDGGQCIASASTLQRSIRDALARTGAS